MQAGKKLKRLKFKACLGKHFRKWLGSYLKVKTKCCELLKMAFLNFLQIFNIKFKFLSGGSYLNFKMRTNYNILKETLAPMSKHTRSQITNLKKLYHVLLLLDQVYFLSLLPLPLETLKVGDKTK